MTAARRVLVTGASGFVGTQLCAVLEAGGCRVTRAVRYHNSSSTLPHHTTVVGEIDSSTRWDQALRGVDSIVHLAARVHVLNDSPQNERGFFETNAQGTRRLAEAAAAAGVSRIVFLSSIKVNGEESGDTSFTSADEPHPVDAYGRSKLLAESYLREIADRAGMEAVIVRAPLVYGPGVRANFLRLMRWIDLGVPLPFGSVDNRRSLVSIWNLCDLLTNLVTNPRATARVWLACDQEQLSTPELIRRLATAMRRKPHLWRVPVPMLRAVATLAGKSAEINRLCGSLTIDPQDNFAQLGWAPPIPVNEAIARTVAWYLAEGAVRAR